MENEERLCFRPVLVANGISHTSSPLWWVYVLFDSLSNKLLELFRHDTLRHLHMPVQYMCRGRQETGRKIERQNRGQWKNGSGICQTKRLQPLEDDCMENTESLSFILIVNLNLDEVQYRPCLCFKTKAKLLSLKLGWALWWMSEWNTGEKKHELMP